MRSRCYTPRLSALLMYELVAISLMTLVSGFFAVSREKPKRSRSNPRLKEPAYLFCCPPSRVRLWSCLCSIAMLSRCTISGARIIPLLYGHRESCLQRMASPQCSFTSWVIPQQSESKQSGLAIESRVSGARYLRSARIPVW
jgi:hypothetical protein